MKLLILFDIDGTLLLTNGAGIEVMVDACRDLYDAPGLSAEGVEVSGRLDPLIWTDLLAANGLEPTPERFEAFLATFPRRLQDRFEATPTVEALPGTHALVQAVCEHEHMTAGLLTGNLPACGRLKVEAAGFDFNGFRVCAWGDDGAHRRDLVPVALSRCGGHDATRTVIIGDTPHDVDCAHAHRARCLAVATGRFDEAALDAAGADRVAADLADTTSIMDWLESWR